MTLGHLVLRRSAARGPRWEEPLSATRNTRRAERYGSWPMTCATRRSNGAMPVLNSQRPNSLDAGLLVGGEHIITWSQCIATPPALVEIENAAGLAGELPIAWENPGPMPPWAQCILAEPAP